MRLDDIINQNIGIWGCGQEGQSICRRILKMNRAANISVFDDKADIAKAKISEMGGHLSAYPSEDIVDADLDVVIKSPGISLYRDEITALKERNIPITSVSSLWFAEPHSGRVIAVSGTKGKSTSASLLAHMIRESGKKVQLAGNIGFALSDCWPNETDVDYWVIELSSFQLADLSAEFDALIITNIYQDHLNWHGSADQYQRDKLNAIDKVRPNGMIVAPDYIPISRQDLSVLPISEDHINRFRWDDYAIYDGDKEIFRIAASSPIHGRHNLHNATIALAMLDRLGFELPRVLEWIETYSPLPHRLQLVGEKDDVRFINDSISTTPQSSIAALEAFKDSNIAFIVGGQDRGVDLGPLVEYLKDNQGITLFALPDTGSKIIDRVCRGELYSSLNDAMNAAWEKRPAINVILMSPGAASFNQFANYQQRGECFIEVFNSL